MACCQCLCTRVCDSVAHYFLFWVTSCRWDCRRKHGEEGLGLPSAINSSNMGNYFLQSFQMSTATKKVLFEPGSTLPEPRTRLVVWFCTTVEPWTELWFRTRLQHPYCCWPLSCKNRTCCHPVNRDLHGFSNPCGFMGTGHVGKQIATCNPWPTCH